MTQVIEISGKPYVSAEDAAHMTGLSHRHVTRMAETEKIPSKRLGRFWFISLRDLATLAKSAPIPRS